MAKIKYYYDTESCKYERYTVPKSDFIIGIIGFIALSFVIGIGIAFFYSGVFQSKHEVKLQKDNEELKLYYDLLTKKLDNTEKILGSLQERDDNVYRLIFSADPIPSSIREAGVGGTQRYKDIIKKGIKNEELVVNTLAKIDKLKRKMYIQTKSYDEIIKMVKNKEIMLSHIPAIQPISNKELTRISSGFGMRYHPYYKVGHMHSGIDFTAPMRTPIYATADGEIIVAKNNFGGYGKEVQVDHGYGYKTLYAHMSKINCTEGQKVKRGQCIGYVGSTGMSTGPHLHYEVIHKGVKVDPVYFFFNDLRPEDYEKVLELASKENQSMG